MNDRVWGSTSRVGEDSLQHLEVGDGVFGDATARSIGSGDLGKTTFEVTAFTRIAGLC